MNKFVVGVIAVIRKDDRFLVLYKDKKHPRALEGGGPWEFPGGKLEYGENVRDGMEREIAEETCLTTEVAALPSKILTVNDSVLLHYFVCNYVSGDVQISTREHSQYKWVTFDEYIALEKRWPNDTKILEELLGTKVIGGKRCS